MANKKNEFHISVDTGGTFTDVVVADQDGVLTIGKSLTTPQRIFDGIRNSISVAAEEIGQQLEELVGRTSLFVYGTTRATNAIIERTTARTAFLVTEGFPDILVRREGGKINPWDFDEPYPEPYIPRRLTREIRERITAEGEVYQELDRQQAEDVINELERQGVEAVAVCFLWSIVNPDHELVMGEMLERHLPGVPYTLSHKINPVLREYRRASSTAIDASLKPLMQAHLREMESDLKNANFTGDLLVANSFGGLMHIDDIVESPIHTVRSGPALAPVLGKTLGEAEKNTSEVIVCDTGGTSFDVSLIRDGRPVFTRETWLGSRYTGDLTGLSSVDVRSIGSGGGSIAWIDSGGLLRVGPESAGAEPGPACYGRGGTEPTVTDAALVLGYLDAKFFLGGRMSLDLDAATTALTPMARQLDRPVEDAAASILTIANEHMVEAIKEITINEGVDPRDSLLLAGGGAAGINIVPIARELGCREILVPRSAGALSACGAQFSDILREFSLNRFTTSKEFETEEINGILDELDTLVQNVKSDLQQKGIDSFSESYFVEARYLYQAWELEVPLRVKRFQGAKDLEAVVNDFHETHKTVFAVNEPGQTVEFVHWKVQLQAHIDKPSLLELPVENTTLPEPRNRVNAYFPDVGRKEIPAYTGSSLGPGMRIPGPALILEPTTTIVVYPRSSAEVTGLGNYLVSLEQAGN